LSSFDSSTWHLQIVDRTNGWRLINVGNGTDNCMKELLRQAGRAQASDPPCAEAIRKIQDFWDLAVTRGFRPCKVGFLPRLRALG